MKKNLIPFLFFILCFTTNYSQELVAVTDEVLTVNSATALSGYPRNKAEVTLPEKTIGYIYRISIFPKGQTAVNHSLFDLLKEVGGTNISLASSFAKFAIKNNDGNSADAFIFNNTYDADNFYAQKDTNWNACKTLMNRASCCFATNECLGNKIYFGFKNNNLMQGLDVKLEIVALVNKFALSSYQYTYAITNAANIELKYSISSDKLRWEETSLRNGYIQNHTMYQKEIYFKINTGLNKTINYKLIPNERYKIYWNIRNSCWDLMRF